MTNQIQTIKIVKLFAHPDNPNRMSRDTFSKLVRNIERTGRYEPIVVRPKGDVFEIINGHHRVKALKALNHKSADCLIWDVDDKEADILLATLNRLSGSDELARKIALLRRLNEQMKTRELGRLLPQTAKQIERLTNLKLPTVPTKIDTSCFLHPMTFFVTKKQQKIIQQALSLAVNGQKEKLALSKVEGTKAKRNAAALTRIAENFIEINCHPERSEGSG